MSKTKYDFKALPVVSDRRDAIMESMLDMWGRIAGGGGSDGTQACQCRFISSCFQPGTLGGWGLRTDSLSYAPF